MATGATTAAAVAITFKKGFSSEPEDGVSEAELKAAFVLGPPATGIQLALGAAFVTQGVRQIFSGRENPAIAPIPPAPDNV